MDSTPRPQPWQLAGLPFRYHPILRYPPIFTQFIENLFDLMYPAAVPFFREFGDTLETRTIFEAVSPTGGENADSRVDQAGHRRPRSAKSEQRHTVGNSKSGGEGTSVRVRVESGGGPAI